MRCGGRQEQQHSGKSRVSRFFLCLTLAVLGLLPLSPAFSASSATGASPASNPLLNQQGMMQRVDDASYAKYREIVATFDAAIRAQQGDVALALARCQFMRNYAWAEDLQWAEKAQSNLKVCLQNLKEKFTDDPEVSVSLMENVYGKDAVAQGEALLPKARKWPAEYRARLHAALSNAYQGTQDKRNAGVQAVEAAELSPDTPVLLTAVRHLATTGEKTEARRLLMDAPTPKFVWQATSRINTALDVLPGPTARDLLLRMQTAGLKIDPYTSARAFLQAGDAASAQRTLAETKPDAPESAQNRALRLSVALAARDGKAAAAAIQSSLEYDKGNRWPLAQSYAVLMSIDPAAGMRFAFAGLMLTLLSVGLCIVLFPGLLMFPVHYVGTVRARKGRPTPPLFERIGLRHAWYGLAVLCLTTWALHAFVVSQSTQTHSGTAPVMDTLLPKLALTHFATLGIVVLLLSRTMWRLGRRQWTSSGEWKARWFIWPAALLAVSTLAAWYLAHHTTMHNTELQAWNESVVKGAMQLGGTGLALLLVAVVVPLVEEFVFRGCLLGGLTRHMSFIAANLWQAVIFACVHFDAKHFPFLVMFGLTTGWLAKKTNGLAVPIAMHMLNNAIFVLVVMSR
ncbi:hypothetical protein MB84_20375 [Pandoraea oxalativorans]|uniref:CAAX prenyl protease 2/Lysostaphin resistance protein A-like domain-containing protein n=1 Tax=Pandoraea oxalativorans TaxID=573737 RepID=A0A0E3U801_9BURK|nr:hypothetical protein MB84_20375 [Pandoraea oxalativorans]